MSVRITVTVPMLLSDCTKGRSAFELEAETLQGALQQLVTEYPLLKVHMYNEHGEVRKHVLLYYNNDNIAWLDRLDIPLAAGDKLRVLQAVSGG